MATRKPTPRKREMIAYGIKWPDGTIPADWISHSKARCIQEAIKGLGCSWNGLRFEGYRVVRVKIVEARK